MTKMNKTVGAVRESKTIKKEKKAKHKENRQFCIYTKISVNNKKGLFSLCFVFICILTYSTNTKIINIDKKYYFKFFTLYRNPSGLSP